MESSQELQHWGIKGQKWGIRRYQNEDGTLTEAGKRRYYYQNPDGSLTEEGKKHYMEAARKGKLNPKKLSDADLNMINQRFAKEKTYKQNVKEYEESQFSYKLKKAVIERIKGNGGGGGGKKGGKGIGSLLAMPIKKAFEDAFKFDPNNKANKLDYSKEDAERAERKEMKRLRDHGNRFVSKYVSDVKDEQVNKAFRQKDVDRGRAYLGHGKGKMDVSSSAQRFGKTDATRTGNSVTEQMLRDRRKARADAEYSRTQEAKEQRREEKRQKAEQNRRKRERELEERAAKSGIYLGHSDLKYIVIRSDELMHHGIKGQKWGVRRFQNEDRTLTEAGKERYGVGGGEKKSSNSEYDYKSERRKVGENRPEGFSKKENEIITKIQNGEIIDSETVRKIASDHHSNRFELGKKYQASTSESEKAELKSQMEHEQILMDYAYDKIPAMNRENKYEKEIASETDSKYIDPTYRKFSSKDEKAKAEAEYLANTWHSGMPDDPAEEKKWGRECQHLSDRVWGMSFDGYDGKPQSERVRSMFDYDPDGYHDYERWKPKYEKTEEWKKLQAERQTLKDKTGYTKAEEAFQKAGKEGLYFKDKAAWSKLNHALSDAQRKYEKRVDASDIRKGERKIEDAFYNEVTKYVLQDLGYEITDKNMELIQSVIWYD